MLKNISKKEIFGRSMVEMLGVLAIIGVLSIGGMYGYRMARDRMKMNDVKSWINKLEYAMHESCF